MRAVKISLSLLALFAVALSLSACNTLANRRTLYAPKKGDGYWTRTLQGNWHHRGTGASDDPFAPWNAPTRSQSAPIPPPPPAPLPEAAPAL
jgi:hypothetical protein